MSHIAERNCPHSAGVRRARFPVRTYCLFVVCFRSHAPGARPRFTANRRYDYANDP